MKNKKWKSWKRFKSNPNEELTGFAQILFLASEGQGTSWVMTKSLQTATRLWKRKPKETFLKKAAMVKRLLCSWEKVGFWGEISKSVKHCRPQGRTSLKLTEQMAAGDALLGQCGLQGRNWRGENVRLLKHLRSVWPIQWAEHSAVVELHPLIQFNDRELVPARLGAPVFILGSQTEVEHTFSEVK